MLFRIRALRVVGVSEGISFLLLLLIAMPLKYFFGFPMAVKLVGWAHGVLFMLYLVVVLMAIAPMRWGFKDVFIAFAASLLPAGTFFLDRQWKRRMDELRLTAAT
jgi:integral membrane protein